MDLSTLEKLVKENRFHSREEFFERTELILSNCITFNGTESPLTEIAQKMLQAAQDEHHHQQQQQKAVSSSSKSKLLKRRLSPLKSASKEEKQEGGGEPGEVKKKLHGLIIEKGDTSPHHHRHHDVSFTSSDDQATITPEKSMTNKPVDNNSGGNTGGCGRLLRQRSSGAWYGVDLEYDDDDDDESDEDGSARSDDDDKYTHKPSSSTKRIPITGSRSGTSKQWMTTEIDDDESNELLYTSKSNQSTSKLQDSEHTEDSSKLSRLVLILRTSSYHHQCSVS
ncbi:unnamed protein product [Trichobilharzia regenti]|nr:unnamed protein product [Trichobilharzia regenti]